MDNEAKTVVISDEELGEIKHTPKQQARVKSSSQKPEVAQLEEEVYDTDYDDTDEDFSRRRRSSERKKKSGRSRSAGRAITITALLVGAILLIVLIYFVGKAAGLLGSSETTQPQQQVQDQGEDDGLVEVPDLRGKTEAEAKELAAEKNLGTQMIGEEASDQEKGRISSQDIPAGTRVEAYSTLKYYISKGAEQITIPDLDGQTGIDAQQALRLWALR